MKWLYVALVLFLIAATLGLCAARANTRHPDVLPYSCATVRWAVAHFSTSFLEARAKEFGITPAQRRAAEKCLETDHG